MRSSKGLPVLLSLSLSAALLAGCASERPPVNLANVPTTQDRLPLGATRGPVKGTLTPEETKAQFISLKADEYTVKKGDTLWSIANHFLKDPYYWPEIWYDNPQIQNPHKIYPGDKIGIMYIGGKPRLGITMRPHIRYETLPPEINAIPLDTLKPFLSYDQVMSQNELNAAPYVLANRDDALATSLGDVVYARPALTGASENYAIVGKGKALIDPYPASCSATVLFTRARRKSLSAATPPRYASLKASVKFWMAIALCRSPTSHSIMPSPPASQRCPLMRGYRHP